MNQYTVKIAFWLRAYDSFTVKADSDEQAIEMAKEVAKSEIEKSSQPEEIILDDRREGLIAYIDRIEPGPRKEIAEAVPFDGDRIHP